MNNLFMVKAFKTTKANDINKDQDIRLDIIRHRRIYKGRIQADITTTNQKENTCSK
jgi:hypothetical protein